MANDIDPQILTMGSGSPNNSTLMGLPCEIRTMILKNLFSMTRFTYGNHAVEQGWTVRIKPKSHSLAILYVCRTMWLEGHNLWISRVLFNFEDMISLLDRLCGLPEKITSQIRYLRTYEDCLPGSPRCMAFSDAIALIPALQLETLTVFSTREGCPHVPCYLKHAVKTGSKWKTLYHLSPRFNTIKSDRDSKGELASEKELTHFNLNEILEERDGVNSGGSITVYRSKRSDETRVSGRENPTHRVDPNDPPKQRGNIWGSAIEVGRLWRPEYDTLVVVKRGPDVDLTKSEGSRFGHMKWAHLRSSCIASQYARTRYHVEYESMSESYSLLQHLHQEHHQLRSSMPSDYQYQASHRDFYDKADEYRWPWPVKAEKKMSVHEVDRGSAYER